MCNTLWVGEDSTIERGRLQLDIASLSIDGFSKVPLREPPDADNDSPAENTTSDLSRSQLTSVLQQDIEGKSYLFSQCAPVLQAYF